MVNFVLVDSNMYKRKVNSHLKMFFFYFPERTLTSSTIMPTTYGMICILLTSLLLGCSSSSANTSYEISHHSPTKVIDPVETESPKDMQILKNRQSNFAIGGPVAASLAFVGLNLAFISLLVPFVITAVTVGERRNYNEEENQDSLPNMWKNLRSLYGADMQEIDYLARYCTFEICVFIFMEIFFYKVMGIFI